MLLNTQDSLKKLKTKQQPDVVTKTAVPNAPLASEANKEIQSQDSNKTIPDDIIVPSETKQEDLTDLESRPELVDVARITYISGESCKFIWI